MAFRSSPSKVCLRDGSCKNFSSSVIDIAVNAYCSNLKQMAASSRAFSTEIRQRQPTVVYLNQKEARPRWQKLFEQNEKFPFRGSVTSHIAYEQTLMAAKSIETTAERVTLHDIIDKRPNEVKREATCEPDSTGKLIELKALECPKLLKKDLADLFHGVKLENDVSVLSLTQQTEHDMSVWSMEMEIERLQLTSGFIESALAICSALRRSGYWADFIDPSSGRPYLGKYTNATLLETDDRYRSLGFKITDLGCCKVLEHATWGTKAFVGTIFTDAPVHSSAITEILAQVKE